MSIECSHGREYGSFDEVNYVVLRLRIHGAEGIERRQGIGLHRG